MTTVHQTTWTFTMKSLAILLLLVCSTIASASAQDRVTYRYSYAYDDARRLTGVEVQDYLSLSYAYDAAGNRTAATGRPESGVDVASSSQDLPTEIALYTGYPNPFNPTTQIRFDLPSPGLVRIHAFDATGRLVQTLTNGHWEPGRHAVTWDARQAGRTLSSGAYFIRLQAQNRIEVRSVMLVK